MRKEECILWKQTCVKSCLISPSPNQSQFRNFSSQSQFPNKKFYEFLNFQSQQLFLPHRHNHNLTPSIFFFNLQSIVSPKGFFWFHFLCYFFSICLCHVKFSWSNSKVWTWTCWNCVTMGKHTLLKLLLFSLIIFHGVDASFVRSFRKLIDSNPIKVSFFLLKKFPLFEFLPLLLLFCLQWLNEVMVLGFSRSKQHSWWREKERRDPIFYQW